MRKPKTQLVIRLSDAILSSIDKEVARTERSRSWLIAKAWLIALKEIQNLPVVSEDFTLENNISEADLNSLSQPSSTDGTEGSDDTEPST